MTARKNIENGKWWDKAWSLVEGCTPVSLGCAHCWSAAATHMRARQEAKWAWDRYGGLMKASGCFNGKIRLQEQDLDKPLRRRKPTTWAVWNDLFHKDVPGEFIDNAFGVMALCPQHIFLVLTKRAERLPFYFARGTSLRSLHRGAIANMDEKFCGTGTYEAYLGSYMARFPLANVGLGISAEDQERFDERVPYLLKIPAALRFVSLEPLLGAIEFSANHLFADEDCKPTGQFRTDAQRGKRQFAVRVKRGARPLLGWVIVGGETGPGARPTNPDDVRSIRDQCGDAGVPFFLKSLGQGKGRILDGRTHDEIPECGTKDAHR